MDERIPGFKQWFLGEDLKLIREAAFIEQQSATRYINESVMMRSRHIVEDRAEHPVVETP